LPTRTVDHAHDEPASREMCGVDCLPNAAKLGFDDAVIGPPQL
jgi:hypothetical protein